MSSRLSLLFVIFVIIAVALFGRLFYLQVVNAEEYAALAQESRTISFDISPRRGTIYDRNGAVLAISVDAYTIYANPNEVTDPVNAAMALAEILGGDAQDYCTLLLNTDAYFVYVQRQARVEDAEKVMALDLDGIYFIEDYRREYPNGEVGGQVIGYCNADGDGITGLELYYNDILKGEAGVYVAERGEGGIPIPGGVKVEKAAVDGTDIMISLDISFQAYVEEALTNTIETAGAEGGVVMVMDSSTGEIYAATSLPLFDPSDVANNYIGSDQLKCVTQILEPGSVFKSVAAMTLLENGYNDNSSIYCPESITATDYTVTDSTKREAMTMTLREIIARSSNVGISLLTEEMGFDKFYENILKYGFGQTTGIDYPGEAAGYVLDFDYWVRINAYNISFGQGISVTPLQMLRFYGALRNAGTAVTPHFLISYPVSGETPEYQTSVMFENTEAVNAMTSMLESVVTDGTGKTAAIEGFTVAGKTSTAEIAENGEYKKGVYNMAFVGYLPESNSNLVCYVGANEADYNVTVGSLFKDVMTYAITQYKITEQ